MAPSPDAPGPHKNLLGHRIADGRLELVSVLGLGAYGVVYLARDLKHPNHQQPFASGSASQLPRSLAMGAGSASTGFYAVKCLSKVGLDSRQRSFQRREIMLHTIASNHASVVTLHRVIDAPEDPCVYVILDYCPDGDLFSMITEHQRYLVAQPESLASLEDAAFDAAQKAGMDGQRYIDENQEILRANAAREKQRYEAERADMDQLIKKVFHQILDAVEFCHSYGIYHRDLKPENILCLQGGAKVVLADFGLATGEKASSDFGCGSTFYMGPECQGGITTRLTEYSTEANDIWSLGVILVNLICGRNPWKQACTADETFREYLRRPDFLMDILPISPEANDVLKRIFTVRPEWRISTVDLRKMVDSVRHFTVTDEQMKIREHDNRIRASQARAAQKAAAQQAAAQNKQKALAAQRAAQQQQQMAQNDFYARQHEAMAQQQLQQRRLEQIRRTTPNKGQESPTRLQAALYAEAYDDEDAMSIASSTQCADDHSDGHSSIRSDWHGRRVEGDIRRDSATLGLVEAGQAPPPTLQTDLLRPYGHASADDSSSSEGQTVSTPASSVPTSPEPVTTSPAPGPQAHWAKAPATPVTPPRRRLPLYVSTKGLNSHHPSLLNLATVAAAARDDFDGDSAYRPPQSPTTRRGALSSPSSPAVSVGPASSFMGMAATPFHQQRGDVFLAGVNAQDDDDEEPREELQESERDAAANKQRRRSSSSLSSSSSSDRSSSFDDCASNSSRRSSFSYTGLPPTPLVGTHLPAAFGSPVRRTAIALPDDEQDDASSPTRPSHGIRRISGGIFTGHGQGPKSPLRRTKFSIFGKDHHHNNGGSMEVDSRLKTLALRGGGPLSPMSPTTPNSPSRLNPFDSIAHRQQQQQSAPVGGKRSRS